MEADWTDDEGEAEWSESSVERNDDEADNDVRLLGLHRGHRLLVRTVLVRRQYGVIDEATSPCDPCHFDCGKSCFVRESGSLCFLLFLDKQVIMQ